LKCQAYQAARQHQAHGELAEYFESEDFTGFFHSKSLLQMSRIASLGAVRVVPFCA
jgi:hypothetical protein